MTDHQKALEGFLEGLETIDWPEALWKHSVAFFRANGATRVSYHHVAPPGARDEGRMLIVASGFPDHWLDAYISETLVQQDPIVKYALSTTTPFMWSEITRLTELTEQQSAFLERRKIEVDGDGLAVQVFGPQGRAGYVGIGLVPPQLPLSSEKALLFQMACEAAHLRYIAILRDQGTEIPPLTRREKEVLRWTARGKSNSVIGEILGLSPNTIDSHLRRIFAKLGTNDRITAVVRGIGEGIIVPVF